MKEVFKETLFDIDQTKETGHSVLITISITWNDTSDDGDAGESES